MLRLFNPKEIVEELKYITGHHKNKIFDADNPEFYISEIYWCDIDGCFKFKTQWED